MIAEMKPPKFRNVALLFGAPRWTPRPTEFFPSNLATIGLMMLAVNAAIRALKASAMASPTATVMMSPRMMKFLNPVSTPRTSLTVPPRGRGRETGLVRPDVDDDDIVPGQARSRGRVVGRLP